MELGHVSSCGCLICLLMILKDGLYSGFCDQCVSAVSKNMYFLYFFLSIETTDLLQKLSLDSQTKTLEIPEPTKKVIFIRGLRDCLVICILFSIDLCLSDFKFPM